MKKVLLTWQANEAELKRIRSALPSSVEVVAQPQSRCFSRFDATYQSLAEHAKDADAIMGWVLPEGILDIASKLKLICWMHAGCDELDMPTLQKRGVRVTNLRGANSIPVVEHTMALILGLAKRVLMKHQAVVAADCLPLYEDGSRAAMLEGRTLLVIGYGEIGSGVARRAKAFDMKVVGIRRHPERGGKHADEMYGPDQILEQLGHADFVLLATPITSETERFFDEAHVDAMKHNSYLINVARGNLTHELPIHDALLSGKLAGYAADAWWNYTNSFPATYHFPCPSRSGVHKLPNVLGSGDQATNVDGILDRNIDRGIQGMVEFAAGKPLTWEIDLKLGY